MNQPSGMPDDAPRPDDEHSSDGAGLDANASVETLREALAHVEHERRRAEAALRQIETRHRALVHASAHAVYRMSPDGSAMRALHGQGSSAETSAPTEAWMARYIPPDDRPTLKAAIQEAVRTRSAFDVEHRVRRSDDTLGWVHTRAVPLVVDDGAIAEWLVTATDITDRVHARHQLRRERDFIDRVLQTVGALVVVMDPEGQIIRFNRACEMVSGYAAEDAVGQNVFDLLIPPEDHEGVRDYFDRHVAGTGPPFHENHWITKDGDERLLRWSVTTLRDDGGPIQIVISTGIDITHRRRLERQVLSAADEERRRLGQNLHDLLASQLVGIAMMTRALAVQAHRGRPVTDDDLHEVADLINDAGQQARALSHSLMPVDMKGRGLADALRQLVQRQKTVAPHVTWSLAVELPAKNPPDQGPPSEGCPDNGARNVPIPEDIATRLYRIAHEAVANAVQHGKPNAVTIRLKITNDDQLVLTVRDDGIGIPANRTPGDGWGLHLMRYRAELIGARLRVEPVPAGGTRVRCTLPLARLGP